jgi:hypothetical protein
MALPAPLIAAIEAHSCFTGCYHCESLVEICMDLTQPLSPIVHVSCADCLSFRVGALARLLPAGMTTYTLADALTAHMLAQRGYRWALSGYHAVGAGFWLSAAALTENLFLVDSSRNRSVARSEADLLVESFKHKLAQPQDQTMLDPALYAADVVHLNLATPLPSIQSKQDLLACPQCSLTAKPGFKKVTVLEFLAPAAAATAPQIAPAAAAQVAPSRPPAPPPAQPAPPRKLERGDICPVCKAEYTERALFTGKFVGCLC